MSLKWSHKSLGQVLLEVGVVTKEQLDKATEKTKNIENDLPSALIELGFATESQIIKAIGVRSQIPYFDTLKGIVSKESTSILPEKISRKYQVVPLFKEENSLLLAMINPFDINTIDDVARITGLRVEPVITTKRQILLTIGLMYNPDPEDGAAMEIEAATSVIEPREENSVLEIVDYSDMTVTPHAEIARKAPIIKLVDRILLQAIEKKASDIHIEPKLEDVVVRYRIDGMLAMIMFIPKVISYAIISRIKIMSKLDISETRRPQDGRIQLKLSDRLINMRVSTMPTVNGEKVVLRILDKDSTLIDLEKLGFPQDLLTGFRDMLRLPTGIVLVTGPTGSGKTTTLYAGLKEIVHTTKNIVTLEDPVEYQLEEINQIPINNKVGLTFASGLRSLLRQDPDVILVGEIRDQETAHIAINAALTGHLVLSTLHTNDACGALTRLIDMGVESFLLNSALVGVLAQRLIRLLCLKCRKPHIPDKSVQEKFQLDIKKHTLYQPAGCSHCFNTGYSGRTLILELLPLTIEVRQMILEKGSYTKIQEVARRAGFKDMFERSRNKVIDGVTSVEEILRVANIY
ncbi:GspE/PulE family protein [Elusimicrobiota bacterium]